MNIEERMNELGLIAPRVTLDEILALITSDVYHVFEDNNLTICVLTLKNGFSVTGESACVGKENFNADIGKAIAYDVAVAKIWQLQGYLLKEKTYQELLAGEK